MTEIITAIMVEVLSIFGIATKELRRRSASEFPVRCLSSSTELGVEKFLRRLAGRTDLEDALKKLDILTQEEARMALAENLRITHSLRDGVKVVDSKLESVKETVEDVGENVEEIGEKVEGMSGKVEDVGEKLEDVNNKVEDIGNNVVDIGDKVQCVDEKVQEIIHGARGMSSQSPIPHDIFSSDGKQAIVMAKETKSILQQTASSVDEIKCS